MPENSISDGPITNLLSILCILVEILLCTHTKGQKSHNDFRFGTFIGHFLRENRQAYGSERVNWDCT